MKNLLGCEMRFFALRGMWRSLIIGLAIAAFGWPAAQAFSIYNPQRSLTTCCHLKSCEMPRQAMFMA
jgi:hypothetical protein